MPNQVPTSGLRISDQFKEEFGISFRLEGGGFPVLATVGSPTEAFASVWGQDVPAPGVDIGKYFLTDDGVLSGLTSPPLILDFETPIDSFAGCILDMDFGELFIIQALDSTGKIILDDTIVAGDPGTGDGALTCWGFNLPGCNGTIKTIRFAGERQQSGSFGLGLDHFTFCYSGLNIVDDAEPETCNSLGSILVESADNENYQFSIDGVEYFSSGFFENLEAGFYSIFVRDRFGCETDVLLKVPEYVHPDPEVASISTTCGIDNGSATVTLADNSAIFYTIDGINLQTSNTFENLPPGDYTVLIETDLGCELFEAFTIEPSIAPDVEVMQVVDDRCENAIGSLEVQGVGTGLTYSIDGSNFQFETTFENLPAGSFMVIVEDIDGCQDSIPAELQSTPQVILTDIDIQPAICNETNGTINIMAEGGEGAFQYSIDDSLSFQLSENFEGLPGGTYEILVIDENQCSATQVIDVPEPDFAVIEDVAVEDTSCDRENGQLIVTSSFTNGVQYSINGAAFQNEDSFTNLPPGNYDILITDENGCTSTVSEIIEPSFGVEVIGLSSTPDECLKSNGTIMVQGTSANGAVQYALDNREYNDQNEFDDIEKGMHTVFIIDEFGCEEAVDIAVDSTPVISINSIEITEPDCFTDNGEVVFNTNGGTGELVYSFDDRSSVDSSFTSLGYGNYELVIVDELGCETRESVTVPIPLCPIYFPNIISPNENAPNNKFFLYTHPDYDVGITEYRIYDRWGELVFISGGFLIHAADAKWWDGRINGKMAEQDVYTYLIDVLHPNGVSETYADDIMLMR